MQQHSWRENEGDETHFWRANHHGGRWSLYERAKEDEAWNKVDPIKTEHWEALREVLWNKYQRKRCSYNLIAKIDKRLGKTDERGK